MDANYRAKKPYAFWPKSERALWEATDAFVDNSGLAPRERSFMDPFKDKKAENSSGTLKPHTDDQKADVSASETLKPHTDGGKADISDSETLKPYTDDETPDKSHSETVEQDADDEAPDNSHSEAVEQDADDEEADSDAETLKQHTDDEQADNSLSDLDFEKLVICLLVVCFYVCFYAHFRKAAHSETLKPCIHKETAKPYTDDKKACLEDDEYSSEDSDDGGGVSLNPMMWPPLLAQASHASAVHADVKTMKTRNQMENTTCTVPRRSSNFFACLPQESI